MKPWLDRVRWLALAVIAAAAVFNYRGTFKLTAYLFNDPLEDMSHGWIVPLVSLFVLWRQRRALAAAAGNPSWRGAAGVCFFLMVAWLGSRGGQSRVEQVSLIGLFWAVPCAFWGRGVGRLMSFPAAYLLFTVPVSSFIDFFTIHLRILSSSMATGLLNGLGVMVERSGTALFSRAPGAEFNVDVADPCSGIRSLFAMMALTAAYAYFTQKTALRKWALFACSLPIAVVGNMVRIMSICLVASWFGQEIATGYYHDYSGYVIFLVGVLMMIQTGKWIEKAGAGAESRVAALLRLSPGPQPAEVKRFGMAAAFGVVISVSALTLGVFAFNASLPPTTYDSAMLVASSLPETVGAFSSDAPWFCHNPQCLKVEQEKVLLKKKCRSEDGFVCPVCGSKMHSVSLGEATKLPKDTVILKRNYCAEDGEAYSVSVVIGGMQRNSIHRAELCLPAQGYTMLDAQKIAFRLPDGKQLWARKIEAKKSGEPTLALVYWFLSRGHTCCSHTQRILTDIWDRSIHNRINRWVMVAVTASSPVDTPEDLKRLEAFLSQFYSQIAVDPK